jgi:60 kDa SS-A/Ro ribonucleoprotein
MNYAQHLTANQQEQARPDQRQNSAGGWTFQITHWQRLERFLILGSEGGTYYVSERKLTRDNATTIAECIKADGARTVRTIVEVSQAGRAPKNDPAIFALALCAGAEDPATRRAALDALPLICRTGTHLFHFAQAVEQVRRWGHGLRRAVAAWYTAPDVDGVALQAVKYQQRDGWSHRDLLRLSHPVTADPARAALFRWITTGADGLGSRDLHDSKRDQRRNYDAVNFAALPQIVVGFERIKMAQSAQHAAKIIAEFRLPHECVPNQWKDSAEVWAAMLPHMGLTAIVRNLGKMTAVGLLAPLSQAVQQAAQALTDPARLKRERVHPLALLVALKIYAQGHGDKGKLSWSPVPAISQALNEGFYLAFQAIEPTGKNHLLALDVSGSMGSQIAGMPISAREATAAMSMVTARTEQHWHVMGFSNRFVRLNISPAMRLDDVNRAISGLPFESTDCSLPMLWAMENKIAVDTFTVYTDNETYAGHVHPFKALRDYRQKMGRPAKLIVVGTTATEFTIADPTDAGMLDVVGFDVAAPAVMADFARS